MCINQKKVKKMYLIGITGKIGSGKTTVGNILKKLGFVVFDMDVWCRKMYFNKEFLKIIKKNFPECFENNIFDKRKLRELVFSDENNLKKLEALTHPYLKNKLKKTIHRLRFSNDVIFIQSALLYQMGLEKYCAFVLKTYAPYEILKNRVMKRDCINQQSFENIINKQQDVLSFQRNSYIIETHKSLTILKADLIKLMIGLKFNAQRNCF
ncbi:MAG: dephospho-CoA kinase [Alphaproteobacteria bacterium]|nr:dephospho-CoA kinase [Alphaproteobacteria bacterium]